MSTQPKSLEEVLRELPPERREEVKDFAEFLLEKQQTARPDAPEIKSAARARFRECFGSWDSGDENSADNDKIDADLACEYGKGLEAES